MSANRVVIYSNGIADFQRSYEVDSSNPKRISIAVRQDHLADVLASFNVYGKVKLESPPTFRPSNELEGNISINPTRALEDLSTSLSGAQVEIDRPGGVIAGTLVGLHEEPEGTAGEPINSKSLIVLTNDGLRRCAIRDIQSLRFQDEDVRREIDKALQRNYQSIKPNSTFVELELSTTGESQNAIVQYTIPAAAWKISYRLRIVAGRTTELQGFAIVDNNTDEDWVNYNVCVVTGEPITFSTDLAESKTPNRSHVNLVSENALGAVEVEEEMVAMGGGSACAAPAPMRKRSAMTRGAMAADAPWEAAEVASVEVQEVGDFCVFESSDPVNIPAKRSTVIPVFIAEIDDAKSVLHYKHQNHPTRPYRSVDFTNNTNFSLGRGVCTVYDEGAYAGNCIIPALKQGQDKLLPHALETGVAVDLVGKRLRSKVVAIRIANGILSTHTEESRATEYHIRNHRDQNFDLVLDHNFSLAEPNFESSLLCNGESAVLDDPKQLANGLRYLIPIRPKAELVLKIAEQRIQGSKIVLVSEHKHEPRLQIDYLEQNIIASNGPLADHEGVRECVAIFAERESKRKEIAAAEKEVERLIARQERLRANIKSGGQDELTNRWRSELDEAEQKIRQNEEQLVPSLQNDEQVIQSRLENAMRSLSAEWKSD
ncbi:MAG: hypothetical protein ACI9HK_002072 [Pirellulaceae bacterium]|jgi:hypothetical protein